MPSAETTVARTDTGPRSRLRPGTRISESAEFVRGGAPRPTEQGRSWSWVVVGGTVAAGVVGVVLIALAARLAAGGDAGAAASALGWVGLGVAVLPAAAVACTRDATGTARWTALATVALVTVAPVGLRAGAGPATPDDLMRYAQLSALRRGAPLLVDRLPSVVADQPGLAALTTAVWRVSGLTVWHSALVVVVLVHVVAVAGVRVVVRALGFGERIAVLAAVLWSLGPAVLVATSRVSGATLGLALLLWSFAAVAQAARSATPVRRVAWSGTAVGLAAATAVTDLVSAWTLVGLVLAVAAATVGVTGPPVAGREVRRAWWPAAVGVAVVTVLWSVTPAGREVLGDLPALGAQHARPWATGGAEVALAVVALLLGLGLAGFGVTRLRDRFRETGPRLALGVAALFPVSLLGLLAAPTATLAVVLWPVLVAMLAPLVAAGALAVWDLGARRTRSAAPDRSVSQALRQVQRDTRTGRPEPVRPAAAARAEARPGDSKLRDAQVRDRRVPLPVAVTATLVAVALVLLGASAATSPAATDRIGAPVASGPLATAELLAVADRLTALAGPGFRFVASDPQLAQALEMLAGGVEVTTVPADTVFAAAPTTSSLADLRAAGVGWLVDADASQAASFGLAPGLTRVLSTSTLTVYRVRPAVVGADSGTGSGTGTAPGADVVPAGGS